MKLNSKLKVLKVIVVIFLVILICMGIFAIYIYNRYKVSTKIGEDEFANIEVTDDNIAVTVLGYHSINDDESIKSPIIIGKDRLREHLQAIEDLGFTTISVSDLENYLENGKPIPRKSVLITFDDGYLDNYLLAYPLLREFNMKATIFVAPSLLNENPYMTVDQVKELSENGIDIQSHTFSHKDLNSMSYDDQLNEFIKSKKSLEKLTSKKITAIAYPKGLFNDDTLKASKDAGYDIGFTVKKGFAYKNENNFKINRVLIDYTYSKYDIEKVLIESLISK